MMPPVAWELARGAGPEGRGEPGRPLRGPDQDEGGLRPLTFDEKACPRPGWGTRPARGYGGRPSSVKAAAHRDATAPLGAGLERWSLWRPPQAGNNGAGPSLPWPGGAARPVNPFPGARTDAREN